MSEVVKKWLKQRIAALDSVKSCAVNADGALVVQTWLGTVTHIHLLGEPPKARNLRHTLQEATRVGVGSLFIVDLRLLPPFRQEINPDEWLIAVHNLSGDRLYTYRVGQDGPRLAQAHLALVGRGSLREAIYGPDVNINGMTFGRVWLKTPTFKGDWLAANFGSDSFWKSSDYVAARAAYCDPQTPNPSTNGHTQASLPLPKSQLDLSFACLGLPPNASAGEVKAAFRKRAMETHPDVSHLPKDEAEARFKTLSAAYNYIRETNGW